MKKLVNFLKNGDFMAESYKSISAKFTIIFMLMIGGYIVYSKMTMPLLVSRENIVGIVTYIKHGKNNNSIHAAPYVEIEVSDKKTIKLSFLRRPHPVVGDQVPLIIEVYDDDKKSYSVNYRDWKLLH